MPPKKYLSLSLGIILIALGLTGWATVLAHHEVISTPDAPSAIGPYSQAIMAGNTLFLSGQIAIDPKTGKMNKGSIEKQTKQVMENLKAVLAAANMNMNDVVSTTVYLSNLDDFTGMNNVYGSYFKENPPARVTVQVVRLPREASVEISAIAVSNGQMKKLVLD